MINWGSPDGQTKLEALQTIAEKLDELVELKKQEMEQQKSFREKIEATHDGLATMTDELKKGLSGVVSELGKEVAALGEMTPDENEEPEEARPEFPPEEHLILGEDGSVTEAKGDAE